MSRWDKILKRNERIAWQGRPAPRAYTFRNWRWSLMAAGGLGLLLFFWLGGGSLPVDDAVVYWWTWTGLTVGFWFCVGHILWARMEWEHVFYMMTDQRLVAVSGILGKRRQVFPLKQIRNVEQQRLGKALATIRVLGGGRSMALHCLEYPHLLLQLLSSHVEPDIVNAGDIVRPAEDV